MFGTLRIGSEKNSVEFIEYAKGEAASRLGGYVFSHSACESCRLKKLRCSGHKSGCDRCKGQGIQCSYKSAAESNGSRPKSRSQNFQANFSTTSGSDGANKSPSPLDNNGVDQEIGGWEIMTEADQTGTVVTNTSQFSRELSHVNPGEASHLNEDELNGIEFNDDELNDLFSNIAGLQPDDMQTNAFMGAANHALLDTEAFDTLTDTTNSILDDIGDFAVSQTGSVDVLSQFMAFDHARTSPSSSSRQNSDASTSDDFIATPATSIGRPRSRTDPSSCQCRRSILRVLSDVETNILSASASNIYAILSYQRRITAASNDILTSRICNCRIKFFGLLGIIGEKITSLSEAIITAFVCRMKEQNDSVTDFGESSSSPRNSAIRLGEFQVQTLQEFKVVSAAVIKLQLKYSVNFVSRTRELAISMNRLAQAQSLKKLESRLKELFLKMQRCSELESDFCEI